MRPTDRKWWKEGVIYQIYPRSFKDSNGDGTGDLKGILSELDYIARLGVDIVWLNPVLASPGDDNGYDVSDYRAIQPEFGTMEDMEELIGALHGRKIRLIMDMVVNHTSDEHHWFREARKGRNNPYYKFYHWWPAEKGKPPHRESFFDPDGHGWKYNEATDSWYLHIFSEKQPDLNWENPGVRNQIYEILRFWLDKGIDGFRLDATTFISKDTKFPVIGPETLKQKYRNDWGYYYADGPFLHEYLREMNERVISKYDAVVLAEGPGVQAGKALEFLDPDRKELHLLTHFDGMGIGYLQGGFKRIDPAGYDVRDLKMIYSKWTDVFREKGWGTLYLGNHDQPRMVTRWGNDSDAFRDISAKMLFTFLLSMRSTPFIYNGDEIGMTNIRFEKIGDYRDIETISNYRKLLSKGGDGEVFLKDQQLTARDNGRTPFQWNAAVHAGFTTGTPWIPVNKNYPFLNAAAQEKDPTSILRYTRAMLQLRKKFPVLVYGDYALMAAEDPQIYAYTRSLDDSRLFVLINFSKNEPEFIHPFPQLNGKNILINNYPGVRLSSPAASARASGTSTHPATASIHLYPYQAIIFGID